MVEEIRIRIVLQNISTYLDKHYTGWIYYLTNSLLYSLPSNKESWRFITGKRPSVWRHVNECVCVCGLGGLLCNWHALVKPTAADASASIIQRQKAPHTSHLQLYTTWHQLTSLIKKAVWIQSFPNLLYKTSLGIRYSCCLCSSPFLCWCYCSSPKHFHGMTNNNESNTPKGQLHFSTDSSKPQCRLHPQTEVLFQQDSEDKKEQ